MESNSMNGNFEPKPLAPRWPDSHSNYGALTNPNDFQSHYYGHGIEQPAESAFSVVAMLNYLIRYRWLIFVLACLGFIIGVVYTSMQEPRYRASTQVEMLQSKSKVLQDLEISSNSGDRRAIQTAIARLKSRSLAQKVVFELNLTNNPNFIFQKQGFGLQNISDRLVGSKPPPQLKDITPKRRESIATAIVSGGTSASNVRGTSIINIVFTHPDPALAAKIVDQIAASFIQSRLDQTSTTSVNARSFLQEQVAQSQKRLVDAETKLLTYAKEQQLTFSDDENSLIASSLSAINTALSEAVQKRLELKRAVDVINAGQGENLQQIVDSEGIARMTETLTKQQAEYQRKLETFKPAFPEMRQLRGEINALRAQRQAAIQTILNSMKLNFQAAIDNENDLKVQLKVLEANQASFQDKRIQYSILKREVDSARTQLDSLNAKLSEVGVASELRNADAVVIDTALVPRTPFEPSMKRNAVLSVLIALLLAFGLIYLNEMLNNTFVNPEQVERDLGLTVLGIIPHLPDNEIEAQLLAPTSAISESYRSLRTSVQFSSANGIPSTLLVTSGQQSEGKSTTAYQMARQLAALGNQVLLLDADMRKPAAHRQANLDNIIGLSNILTNAAADAQPEEIFNATDLPNLFVITAGPKPPNPADLLSSNYLAIFLNAAKQKFDTVIIDSPPVIGLSDAILLSKLASGTIFCVSSNQIPRKAAVAATKRLKAGGGNILGTVVTKFNARDNAYGDNYRYMDYGYYNYGEEAPPQLTNDRATESQMAKPNTTNKPNRAFVTKVRNLYNRITNRMVGTG